MLRQALCRRRSLGGLTALGGRIALGLIAILGSLAFMPSAARSQTPSKPPAQAVQKAPAKPPAPPVALKPGQVDLGRSRAYVKVGATGMGHEHGCFGHLVSGSIELGAPRAAGKIVLDMKSFTADSAEARKYVGLSGSTDKSTADQVTSTMRGAGVLDVARHPTAVFDIESAKATGKDAKTGAAKYQLAGKFTLHGVTRALKVDVTSEPVGDTVRLRGGFYVLQTDYGITPYSKLLGTIGVADRLTIWGDLTVQAAKGASGPAAGSSGAEAGAAKPAIPGAAQPLPGKVVPPARSAGPSSR